MDVILNARITQLLSIVRNGTRKEGSEAIKKIRLLSPYKYASENITANPSQFYLFKLEAHLKKHGFNYLQAAENLFIERYGGIKTRKSEPEEPRDYGFLDGSSMVAAIKAPSPDLMLTTPTDSDHIPLIYAGMAHEDNFVQGFFDGVAEGVVKIAHHPLEYVKDVVQSQLDLAKEIGLFFIKVHSVPDSDILSLHEKEMEQYELLVRDQAQRVKNFYNHASETIFKLSARDWGKAVGRLSLDFIAWHGIAAGASTGWRIVKNAPVLSLFKESPLLGKLHDGLARVMREHPELVTAEGLMIKGSQIFGESSILLNSSDKLAKLPCRSLIKEKLLQHEKWFKLANKEQSLRSSKVPRSLEPAELKEFERYMTESERLYEKIRGTNDIKVIAKNTHLPEEMIRKIKRHVFFNKHFLSGEKMRFPADGDMAAAWIRLQKNKALASDILLLKHELAESVLMESFSLSQREAHDIANRYYNWYILYK